MPTRRFSKSPNEFFRRLAIERRKNQHSPVSRSEEFEELIDKFLLPDKSGNGVKLKFDQADKSGNGVMHNCDQVEKSRSSTIRKKNRSDKSGNSANIESDKLDKSEDGAKPGK